jgi:multidrug efflux system outer membrane protein
MFHLPNRLINMKKIIIIGVLLVLAGCAVGPKYSRPETKSSAAYTQAIAKTDSITNMKWWDVYQDTALKKLIDTAIVKNLDLKQAVARIEETKAILGFNKANMAPFLDYGVRGRASDFGDVSNGAGVTFPTNSFSALRKCFVGN